VPGPRTAGNPLSERLNERHLIDTAPAVPPGRTGALPRLAVDTLQWVAGLWSAVVGALMLVAPHRFETPPYARLLPHLILWGLAFLASGIGLLSVPILRPRRGVTVALHAAAGLALLGLAAAFAAGTGSIIYASLGLGVWIAGFLPGPERSAPQGGDLFALVLGVSCTVASFTLLGPSPLFTGAQYGANRPLLPWFGLAWLALFPLLGYLQLRPRAPRGAVLAVHLAAGAAALLFGLLVALPARAWTGVAFYLISGPVVMLLPALRRRLARVDAGALRARLALALALTATIALILAVAVVTAQEERLAAEQTIDVQRIEAASVAQEVGDFLSFNAARLSAIAAVAGLAPLEPAAQAAYLERARLIHPDVSGFATLDPRGGVVAMSGTLPLDHRAAVEVARAAFSRKPLVGLRLGSAGRRKLLILSAPISGPPGRPVGALVAAFGADSLARRLERAGSLVTLADGAGQEIARFDRTRRDGPVPPLPAGWDRAVAAGRAPAIGSRLATFSRLPQPGWAVAVERPRAAALAGVRRGRDLAFGLLVACTLLAIGAGLVRARRIARPLGTLADAVDQVTAGNLWAPLSPSRVSEVARLSAAFRLMRDRLAARTAESERLAAELLARAEALAETDRRKDEFLAMLAHELRNPLGAIANASYLLEQTADGGPPARAAAVVRRQVQHLVRLVDDLLDVSRITRGKVELQREPLDLVDVVCQAVESTRPLVEARGHALEVALPAAPLPLSADVTRLEQVLSNLLRNAAKFTEPGGSIAVAAGAEGGYGVVRVRDSGIGIPSELLPRVFDLFTQGEQGLDRAGAGLGIGLTIVQRLVELHGGEVEARSAGLGQGAEFIVRLPLAGPAGRLAERPPLEPTVHHGA
jgi:signal transduction histidine kinase